MHVSHLFQPYNCNTWNMTESASLAFVSVLQAEKQHVAHDWKNASLAFISVTSLKWNVFDVMKQPSQIWLKLFGLSIVFTQTLNKLFCKTTVVQCGVPPCHIIEVGMTSLAITGTKLTPQIVCKSLKTCWELESFSQWDSGPNPANRSGTNEQLHCAHAQNVGEPVGRTKVSKCCWTEGAQSSYFLQIS